MTRWAPLEEELAGLRAQGRLRELREWTPGSRPGFVRHAGRELLDLASNDYLGLAGRHLERDAARELLDSHGFSEAEQAAVLGALRRHGAGAARLVTGTDAVAGLLERELARLKGSEAALVFGSGYAANVGTISALLRRGDAVFSDQLNHASIIDGVTLSRADRFVYRHRDMTHLEELLRECRAPRKLIVTDSVFSMDGTLAPLAELVALKEQYGAWLMLDEAHASGVYGEHGAGLAHHYGLHAQVDILMGTLSKAYGSVGAYVAGDEPLVTFLLNAARSFVFTTGLPPATLAVSLLNLLSARSMQPQRERLHGNARRFREALRAEGHDTGGSESHIVPLIVGSDARALSVAGQLQAAGFAAIPIRPPSVPAGTARIRFALGAPHGWPDLSACLDAVRGCLVKP